ncbi:MAG: phosphohydrolase [Porticoccaceae bacterium]
MIQPDLFECGSLSSKHFDPTAYDRYIVFFSGGKDSIACVLTLLEAGISPGQIELHHHIIDGREGSSLMDWPVTTDYCRAFARAFNIPIYFSWREGGFEREMLRDNARTAPVCFEAPEGIVKVGGARGSFGTRRKFPQVTADLSRRWCSAYLKIDVGAALLVNQARFRTGRTLVVTGERAEESSARAKYRQEEPHRTDRRNGTRVQRHIHHWRAIHGLTEADVWGLLQRYQVCPHPAYYCGFSRASCLSCIFGSKNQWATLQKYMPDHFDCIASYEDEFGITIHRTRSVYEQASAGVPYSIDPYYLQLAMADTYHGDIFTDDWQMPTGAFGESCGPS